MIQYIRLELLHVTLCFAAYVLFEAVHRIRPDLFIFLQYVQSRVLQRLLVPDKSVGPGSRLIGSFALTSMFLKFLGLRKAITSFCWWICLVEQDLPRISQFLATIGRRPRKPGLYVETKMLTRSSVAPLLNWFRSVDKKKINVCLVMVVAVRAGHLDFSKKFKFMVIDFNFIQSIQLYRPNL